MSQHLNDFLSFGELLQGFAQLDGFTLILPFVLVFSVTQLVLATYVPVFNDNSRGDKLSVLVALVIALLSTNFLVQNPFYQGFYTQYFGIVTIGLVGMLGFAALLGFSGYKLGDKVVPILVVLSVIASLSAFVLSRGVFAFLPNQEIIYGASFADFFNFLFQTGMIYLIIIGGFIYWAYAGVDTGDDSDYDKAGVALVDRLIGADKDN